MSVGTLTMNWIDNQLAVGDAIDATHFEELRNQGIDYIIDIRLWFQGAEMIPVSNLKYRVRYLYWHSVSHKIFIHCQGGMERSPFVAMLYCCWKYGWDYDIAYKFVSEKRPQTIEHREWIHIIDPNYA